MRVKTNLDIVIYDHIVDSLILGEYEMGQTILLDEFAEKYEVSRTPVTQAVRLLANDGLLNLMSNGRVMVPEFDKVQMEKVCDVRLLLEEFAIRKIISMKQAEDKYYDLLERIAKNGMNALQLGDKLEFNKKDLEFHSTLVAACDNEYLLSEYKRIQGKFIVANYLMLPLDKRDFSKAAESHILLAEALRKHDLETCFTLIKEHIFCFSTPF